MDPMNPARTAVEAARETSALADVQRLIRERAELKAAGKEPEAPETPEQRDERHAGYLGTAFGEYSRGWLELAKTAIADAPGYVASKAAAAGVPGAREAEFVLAGAAGVQQAVEEEVFTPVFGSRDPNAGMLKAGIGGLSRLAAGFGPISRAGAALKATKAGQTGAAALKLDAVTGAAARPLFKEGTLGILKKPVLNEGFAKTLAARTAVGATTGTVADAATLDPRDDLGGVLADAAKDVPGLGPVLERLRYDPEDPDLVNDFRQAVIGAGFGGVMEHGVAALRALRVGARLNRAVRSGRMSPDQVDPEALRLAQDAHYARAYHRDAKEVIGTLPKPPTGWDSMSTAEQNRWADAHPTDAAGSEAAHARATGGAEPKADAPGAEPKADAPGAEPAGPKTPFDGAKNLRSESREVRDAAIAAFEEYAAKNPAFRRMHPQAQKLIMGLARAEEQVVELVATGDLKSELGRRVLGKIYAKGGGTTREFLSAARAAAVEYGAKGTTNYGPSSVGKRGHLNLDLMNSTDEVKVILNGVAEGIAKADPQVGASRSWEVERAAVENIYGKEGVDRIMQGIAGLYEATVDAPARIAATKRVLDDAGVHLAAIAIEADEFLARGLTVPTEIEARLATSYENTVTIHRLIQGTVGNFGRAMNFMKVTQSGSRAFEPDSLEKGIRTIFGDRTNMKRVIKALKMFNGDPVSTMRYLDNLDNLRMKKGMARARAMHELFVTNALAALRTHFNNWIGNGLFHGWDVIERGVIAETIRRGRRTGYTRAFLDANRSVAAAYGAGLDGSMYMLRAITSSMRENAPEAMAAFRGEHGVFARMRAAKAQLGKLTPGAEALIRENEAARNVRRHFANVANAWKEKSGQLVPQEIDNLRGGTRRAGERGPDGQAPMVSRGSTAWDPEVLLTDPDAAHIRRRAIEYVAGYTQAVHGAMVTADEMFANLNYFVEERRLAYLAALDRGLSHTEAKAFARDYISRMPDEAVAEIQKKALGIAKRNIFQEDAPRLSVGSDAGQLVLDYTVPFKTTPYNLTKLGTQRTPFGFLISFAKDMANKDRVGGRLFRGDFSVLDTEEGAEYLARHVMTGAVFSAAWVAWKLGTLQGSNSGAVDQFKAAGKQEGAIVLGDKSYQFQRMSPIAVSLITAADFFDTVDQLMEQDDASTGEVVAALAGGFFYSLMNLAKNQNMFFGLASALETLSFRSKEEAEASTAKFVGTQLGTQFVPNFVPHIVENVDLFGLKEQDYEIRDTKEYDLATGDVLAFQSMLNALKVKAGLRSQVDAVKRTIFGPVKRNPGAGWDLASPFPESEISKNPGVLEVERLTNEMSAIGQDGIPVDLSAWLKESGGFVLKPKDRDELGEIFNATKVRGQDLVTTLDGLVTAEYYKDWTDVRRTKEVRKVITRFKDAAEREFFSRRPDLDAVSKASRTYSKLLQTQEPKDARADSRVQALTEYWK